MPGNVYSKKSTGSMSPAVAEFLEVLENCLVIGEIRPRETLVVEDLSQRFGLKPYVVRQAIEELERRRIVVKRRNNSAMVRDFSLDELRDYYDVAMTLLDDGIGKVPMPADPALLDRLNESVAKQAAAIEARDRLAVYRHNLDFHETLFAACGNRVLTDMYLYVTWILQIFKSYRMYNADRLRRGVRNHRRMIAALKAGDRERLVELCKAHQLDPERMYEEAQQWVPRGILTTPWDPHTGDEREPAESK